MEIPEGENRPRRLIREFGRVRRNTVSDYDEYIVNGPSNDYESYRVLSPEQ